MIVIDMHLYKALARAMKLTAKAVNEGDRVALYNALVILNLIAPD